MSQNTKTYEAMFLVAPDSDFEAASKPIRTVLARSEAEILSLKSWDERRLAYEIAGQRRGLYILTYFKADPLKLGEIEHDCQLAEDIMRVLIIRKDRISDDEIHAETPTTTRQAESARIAAEADAAAAAAAATAAAAETAEAGATEAAAEPVAEATDELIAEALAEPAGETPAEPTAEAAPEPAVEISDEPVAETAPEPPAEAPDEPVADAPAEAIVTEPDTPEVDDEAETTN